MMDGAKNFYFSTSQVVQRWCKNYVRYIDRTFAHHFIAFSCIRDFRTVLYFIHGHTTSLHTKIIFWTSFWKILIRRGKKKERNDIEIMFVRLLFFFTQILLDLVMFELSIKESIRKLRRDCCCLTLIKSRCMRIYIYIFSEKSFFALLYL